MELGEDGFEAALEAGRGVGRVAAGGELAAGALERRLEARPVERLHQVVEGVRVEGAQGVLVVGGDEDDLGGVGAEGLDDVETGHLRHLDVEEDEVGAEGDDPLDRLLAVAALADDLDVGLLLEEVAEPLAREGLVVDDEGAERGLGGYHAAVSSWAGAEAR